MVQFSPGQAYRGLVKGRGRALVYYTKISADNLASILRCSRGSVRHLAHDFSERVLLKVPSYLHLVENRIFEDEKRRRGKVHARLVPKSGY